MVKNITYLLGAGASANALPMIKSKINYPSSDLEKGLSQNLLQFVKFCQTHWIKERNEAGDTLIDEEFNQLSLKLITICEECIVFGTPDLYAKYLHEKTPSDIESYQLLKILLSNYFTYKQYGDSESSSDNNMSFDQRALVFLSTIFTNRKMPSNVKIISWNYDQQIEIARNKLCSDNYATLSTWPNCPKNFDENFSLIHLNGVAGWHYTDSANLEITNRLTYKNYSTTRNPLISFAWENKDKQDFDLFFDRRDAILNNIVSNTDILVIIGYSFPFFNRFYDERILTGIRSGAKIYYQDPDSKNKINLIRELFNINPDINFHPITFTDQYFIPFELQSL